MERAFGYVSVTRMKDFDISTPVIKADNWEKIGGFTKYIADMRLDGMLYAQTFRSTRVRARIASVTARRFRQAIISSTGVTCREKTGSNA